MAGTSTTERIIDAAVACFARKGVPATTLEDVAAEAGVSRMTVYRHFRSRDGLMVEVLSTTWQRLAIDLLGRLAPIDDFGEQVEIALAFIMIAFRTDPGLAWVIRGESIEAAAHGEDPSIPHVRTIADTVRPFFATAQERGLLRDGVELDELMVFVMRVALSMMTVPGFDTDNEMTARRFVHNFVLPGVLADPPPVAVRPADQRPPWVPPEEFFATDRD
jgi:AcrR family transcriptional regulator